MIIWSTCIRSHTKSLTKQGIDFFIILRLHDQAWGSSPFSNNPSWFKMILTLFRYLIPKAWNPQCRCHCSQINCDRHIWYWFLQCSTLKHQTKKCQFQLLNKTRFICDYMTRGRLLPTIFWRKKKSNALTWQKNTEVYTDTRHKLHLFLFLLWGYWFVFIHICINYLYRYINMYTRTYLHNCKISFKAIQTSERSTTGWFFPVHSLTVLHKFWWILPGSF